MVLALRFRSTFLNNLYKNVWNITPFADRIKGAPVSFNFRINNLRILIWILNLQFYYKI